MDEEKKIKIEQKQPEENLYNEEGREDALDADEINDVEEGFMQGYEEGEKMAKCSLCKKPLGKNIVEKEYNGEIYRFCSEHCADEFDKQFKAKNNQK